MLASSSSLPPTLEHSKAGPQLVNAMMHGDETVNETLHFTFAGKATATLLRRYQRC